MHLNFCSIHIESHKHFTTNYVGVVLLLLFGFGFVFVYFLREIFALSQLANLIVKASTERTYVYIASTNINECWTKFYTAAKNVQIVFAAYRLVSHTSKWFERGKQGITYSITHTRACWMNYT